VQRSFLKTPLRFRRISSRFNRRRFHPILHRTKGHFGVDYAAPRGTPIWAAADGTVTAVKRTRGAGNMVSLRHGGGVRTIYMHLHRFARGLQQGQRVKQRQVIGYVGSTGLATGPHLHYGMYVYGRPIDPLKFKVPEGAPLPASERERFLAEVTARREKLEALALK
jgi:murein DD-endopeptidase MepM/ murein hydrolase activator NlpD